MSTELKQVSPGPEDNEAGEYDKRGNTKDTLLWDYGANI